jgi:Cu+-exporting ATPase
VRARIGEYAYLVGIALIALTIGGASLALAQPEHAGMTETAAAMPMTMPMQAAAEAGVRAELASPPAIAAGQPAMISYQLTDRSTGAPITDLQISHEQPMHLIVVSEDLKEFQHVHPQPAGEPGVYTIDVTFPTAGTYLLYDEFTRASGADLVQQDTLTVGNGASRPAVLAEDNTPKDLQGVRVALENTGDVVAGQEAALTFHLTDADTGAQVRDLQPYLGAPAHVVILSEDAEKFAHTHGEQPGAGLDHEAAPTDEHAATDNGEQGHATGETTYGPEIVFHHTFPTPGLYKVWGQFQTHDGQVIAADFVVRAR